MSKYTRGQLVGKERPILFSAPMVQAILMGIKTQTRRVVTLPCKRIEKKYGAVTVKDVRYWSPPTGRSQDGWADLGVNYQTYDPVYGGMIGNHIDPCPYGQLGDRLWVREAWKTIPQYDDKKPADITNLSAPIYYPADGVSIGGTFHHGKTRASIHMPRWASRLLLEITNIKVERLQSISRRDCRAEGIRSDPDGGYRNGYLRRLWSAELAFSCLWSDIHGESSWASNPYVWVIEFKVVKHDC